MYLDINRINSVPMIIASPTCRTSNKNTQWHSLGLGVIHWRIQRLGQSGYAPPSSLDIDFAPPPLEIFFLLELPSACLACYKSNSNYFKIQIDIPRTQNANVGIAPKIRVQFIRRNMTFKVANFKII